MVTYIAFLRAINVGGRFIKMTDLKNTVEKLGFFNVRTYIQSGNVIFEDANRDRDELEVLIKNKLLEEFKFDVPVFLRDNKEIHDIVTYKPFDFDEKSKEKTLYISLTKNKPIKEIIETLENLALETDKFNIFKNNVFWLYHRNKGKSQFTNNKLERILKTKATRRNMNTVRKIYKKFLIPE